MLSGEMDSKKKKKSSHLITLTVGSCWKEDAFTYSDGEPGELTGQRRYVKRRGRSHEEKEEQYSNTYCRSLLQENQRWCAVLGVLCVCLEPWWVCSVLCPPISMHIMKTCCLQACAMSGGGGHFSFVDFHQILRKTKTSLPFQAHEASMCVGW